MTVGQENARGIYNQHTDSRDSDIGHYLPFLRSKAKGIIFEIGVRIGNPTLRGGASTSAFLLGLEENGGHLYSVDIDDCSGLFRDHPNWSFLRADSKDLPTIFTFVPKVIDILFLDGDHSRKGYVNDLYTYSTLVRDGGLIISHDTDTSHNPGWTIEKTGNPGAPSEAIREEYLKFARDNQYEHYDLPGICGMGVVVKRGRQ